MDAKPLGDRIIVEPIAEEEVRASGLVIPQNAVEKPQRGTVLAVGPGLRDMDGVLQELEVAVDDVVLYSKYGGTELKLEGRTILVLRASDVLLILSGALAQDSSAVTA